MKWLKDPRNRVVGAWFLFFASIIGGLHSVIFIASSPYERILIGISWLAISLTALDVVATTDVRANEDDK